MAESPQSCDATPRFERIETNLERLRLHLQPREPDVQQFKFRADIVANAPSKAMGCLSLLTYVPKPCLRVRRPRVCPG